MSSFINPLSKYATPRSTRSAAASSRSPITKDSRKAASATPLPAKSRKMLQNTPRRAQVPVIGRRTTRSQSREVDDEHTAQRGNGKGKGKRTRPDLAPVGEESRNEIDEDLSDVSSIAARQQLDVELEHEGIPDSPNGHDVSGTTLLPTDSEVEGDFDTISMIESLPYLQAASARLLDYFSSSFSSPSRIAELARQLKNPRSSQSKRLQHLIKTFDSHKEYFGSEVYIPVEKVTAIFPPVDHSTKKWRVDGIIYKANCAQLALEMLTRITMTEDAEQSLYALEGQFPSPFLNALASDDIVARAGNSGLRRQTFDLALQVRTQFLKARLLVTQDGNGHDPNNVLQDVFFNEILESQAAGSTPSQLRGFALSALQDEDGNLPEQYVQDVLDRIREIRTCFTEDGQVDFDALEDEFPWEEFLFTIAKWLRLRNEELNRHLDQQPPVEEILDKLENAVSRADPVEETDAVQDVPTGEESAPRLQTPRTGQQPRRELLPAAEIMERPDAGVRKSFGDLKSLVAFHRVQRRLTSGNAPSSQQDAPGRQIDFAPRLSQLASKPTGRMSLPVTPASKIPAAQASISPALIDTGDIDIQFDINGSQASQQRMAQPAMQPVTATQRLSLPSHRAMHERAVGQAFIDRQANASRVSPIDTQRLSSGGRGPSRKRARDVAIDDEDGEFESDSRRIDLQDRRGQKPIQNTKRPRLENELHERQDITNGYTPSPQRHRRQAPASQTSVVDRPETAPMPSPAATLSQSSPQRPAQSRRPWTREEDEQFIRLVGEHGISWSKIKSEDEISEEPKLRARKQVDLKDRARNLVMIMLKGGTPYEELPKNFEYVALKAADIESLRKRDIHIPERPQKRQMGYF